MDGADPRQFEARQFDADVAPEADEPARSHSRRTPRVFCVPIGTPFLPTLVRSLLDGTLAPGWPTKGADGRPDPLALADATIYVPTRRAARELRATFVAELASGGVATASFLPIIRALGDVDEGAGWFDEPSPDALDLAPVIDPTLRTVALARLTLAWIRSLPDYLAGEREDENGGTGDAIEVPSSPADAVWLARDLEALMDEMEGQGTDWSELVAIDPGEHARWWQLSLQFLAIVTEAWPHFLAANDRANPGAHRNALLRAEARRLAAGGARGPVIVAASPNTGPATVELIDAVARLPNGAVLLPGLDAALSDGEFSGLAGTGTTDAEPTEAEGEPSHPNHGLARLLHDMGVTRDAVTTLGERTEACALRERLVAEAMRPAAATHRWVETLAALPDPAPALGDVDLVEAPSEREEALVCAAALRRGIETPGATAALVTPDRALARRVAAELRRFGIEADDSAGRPVLSTPQGSLMRLALRSAMRPDDAHAVLGLLKHPMARFGLSRSMVRRATLAVELVALRSGGAPEPVDALKLEERFEARLAAIDDPDGREPFWRPRFTPDALDEARELMARLRDALRPLADARAFEMDFPPSVWAANLALTLDIVGEDEDGSHDAIWGDEAGDALARALRAFMAVDPEQEIDRDGTGLVVAWHEVESTFDALLSGIAVRPAPSGHPRVAILGLIESRLLSPDTLVLGGLNEGAWPRQTTTDQFLSRPMRAGLRLEPPERRIGLEAHDFTMAMGASRVVLTRSKRSGTSPTVPSRWLQRLRAVLQAAGEDSGDDASMADGAAWTAMCERGTALLEAARGLDRADPVPRIARPAPTPPLAARPTEFSVTEIETLRRDPYAHYAKRVLRLEPIPDPRAEPDARERGTLIHAVVEDFVRGGDPAAPDAEARLVSVGRAAFARAALPTHVHALWWSHFTGMIPGYLAWERERAGAVADRIVERAARVEVLDGLYLKARADRIDVMDDGTVHLIDYKTGLTPARREAHSLLAPQLALEAAMAQRGGFRGLGRARASSLVYVRLRPGESAGRPNAHGERIETTVKDGPGADALAARAWGQLGALLAKYRDPSQPYKSRLIPQREGAMDGDYDHLARAREWGVGDGEDGDGGGGDGSGGE